MKILVEPGLEGVPILIMANKQDVEGHEEVEEIVKALSIDDLKRKDIVYNGCSAVTNEGVWESVAKLADLMNMLIKGGA